MKYIIVEKKNKKFIMSGDQIDYMENGYPRLVEEDVAFPKDMVDVFELVEIPIEVSPNKYCYTEEKGFYLNSDYVEPKPYTKEQYDSVIVSLIEEGRL